jgi:GT2 family glycosyltransferase
MTDTNAPLVSVIMTSVFPELWEDIYEKFNTDNNIPFEMIVVGPKGNHEIKHHNFEFIEANVKPVQCVEIAARNAKGKHIWIAADDVSVSPGFLNQMIHFKIRIHNEKTLLCPIVINPKGNAIFQTPGKWANNTSVPLINEMFLIDTKIWHQIGGIDKNFIGINFEKDIAFRLYLQGGEFFIVPTTKAFVNKGSAQKKPNLTSLVSPNDRTFLHDLWITRNEHNQKVFSKKRLTAFHPFDNKNITTITQGLNIETDRWE